jgi:hypothetical protein
MDGSPTVVPLDEAWVYLKHPLFRDRLREWLKTIRKLNGVYKTDGFWRDPRHRQTVDVPALHGPPEIQVREDDYTSGGRLLPRQFMIVIIRFTLSSTDKLRSMSALC